MGNRSTWIAALLAGALMIFAAACSQAPAKTAAQAAPAVPEAYRAAARDALGDGTKVILSGDLAHNGHIQLLIVNELPRTPKNLVPGLVVSRAAIIEKDGNDWREIFLADSHLKNEKGFLAGTPIAEVNAWRVQYRKGPKGLAMFFTPLEQTSGAQPPPIEVAWNPAVHRYQSLDRNYKHFLSEASSLGPAPEFRMNQ
jgi:hypothetical protein